MRTLRRPMFRIGGSAGEGITSGLAPRQGFSTGLSEELRKKRMRDVFSGETTLGEAHDLAGAMTYRPRGTTPADALIEFGLNLASAPPSGSIFSTAAGAAKEPFQRYAKSKAESEAASYVSQADMFKSLIEAGAAAAGGEGGKTYAKTEIAKEVRRLTGEIFDAKSEIQQLESQGVQEGPPGSGDIKINQKRIDELNKKIALDRSELNNLKTKSQYASSMLKSDTFRDNLIMTIMQRLKMQTLPNGELKYPKGDNDENLYKDAYREMLRFLEETETSVAKATGGRVGYQQGMSVQPQQASMQQAPIQQPSMQPPTSGTQESAMGMPYEQFRASIPPEISDEIVQLIYYNENAFADFAQITTQSEVDSFNQKYGVTLVLPMNT
jgi:hypothetical protein